MLHLPGKLPALLQRAALLQRLRLLGEKQDTGPGCFGRCSHPRPSRQGLSCRRSNLLPVTVTVKSIVEAAFNLPPSVPPDMEQALRQPSPDGLLKFRFTEDSPSLSPVQDLIRV